MREFAAVLPKLRRSVRRDIELEGMPRERALATAVRLLDLGRRAAEQGTMSERTRQRIERQVLELID